ncbi:MAG: hypothetical protein L0Y38_12395 [Methylococcaceae bacterium]|nr:hypothetical protein [Methylococcaceae bacterium]
MITRTAVDFWLLAMTNAKGLVFYCLHFGPPLRNNSRLDALFVLMQ